jgi:hypothetical protein|tara:strand:+ start:321 stop:503 length:183 start_codon:yes stop_codon:yes gene_type:complete
VFTVIKKLYAKLVEEKADVNIIKIKTNVISVLTQFVFTSFLITNVVNVRRLKIVIVFTIK